MIIMRPIDEEAVLESLDASRFGEDVRGYVVMNDADYLGHVLYSIKEKTTTVCECTLKTNALVDGAIRASVAAGENAGTLYFTVNTKEENLKKWLEIFCEGDINPQNNKNLLENCK